MYRHRDRVRYIVGIRIGICIGIGSIGDCTHNVSVVSLNFFAELWACIHWLEGEYSVRKTEFRSPKLLLFCISHKIYIIKTLSHYNLSPNKLKNQKEEIYVHFHSTNLAASFWTWTWSAQLKNIFGHAEIPIQSVCDGIVTWGWTFDPYKLYIIL